MISSNFVFHCRPAYFKPSGSSETHSKVPVFCSTSYSVTIAFSHCFEHVDFIASACSFVVWGQAVTLDGGANTCGVVSWRQIGPLRWFREWVQVQSLSSRLPPDPQDCRPPQNPIALRFISPPAE
ncbi:hypothetical protein LshimejAT787_2200560 [Lyophyllum shimeji]|uniref:Uncharacterized protein n=1 Tax=Lyophyllum shimeji TaxID=47721 RepID=A0A9P3Q1G9_LYOSH|nr:hypothetical protein LshimejAT787_2200560 [Lyophyllum shimeji]